MKDNSHRKNTIKATIKDFFVIFTLPPSHNWHDGFLMNDSFNQELDELIKELLLTNTPKPLNKYEFQLGDLTLWGENYPYAFGTVESYGEIRNKFLGKRPSRQTIGTMYSMLNNK